MTRRWRFARALALTGLALGCAGSGPSWEQPPPAPPDEPVVREGAVTRHTLENGLRILVHEDHRLPRVQFGVTLSRGVAVESLEEAGIAFFTAELLERGAGERDALVFAETVDALGASFGSGADWDTFGASISGLSRDRDVLLELLADAVLRPRFDAREAERVRDTQLAVIARSADDPGRLAAQHASRAIYADHRYGLPRKGTAETVARFDAARARAFHERLWVPGAAVLSVSGDVEPAEVLVALREHFGAWPSAPVVDPGPPPPAQSPPARRIVVVDRPDLGQARVVLGHEGLSRTDEERIAASLMNVAVGGGGFSSRLMQSLRAEEGLTYGVHSGFSLRRAPGPFSVSTFTRVEKVRQALDLVLAELERARREPPGPDELSWVRTLATGRFALGLETSDAVTASLVDLEVFDLPRDSLDTYRARVRAVTAEDVADVARRHLHPERAAIVLVGPADAIVPQLEGLGPVEVVVP